MTPHILCAGITTFDNIFRVPEIPARGTKIRASALVRTVGGMSANAAIAIARLGGHASLWTRIGDDAEGTRVRDDLRGQGVDTYLASFATTQTALGRLPTAQEVADVVRFLAGPDASAITGQCINVDCGTLPQ